MSVIALTLVGCSKDDENNPINPINPEGYWLSIECDEEDMQHQHGMVFWANGTFGEWSVTPEKFEEMPMGEWEVTDKGYHLTPSISDTGFGIISIDVSYLVFEPMGKWEVTDKGYHLTPLISDTGFGIISIDDSYLVFERYYYWSNTHVKTTYKKMQIGPVYIN